MAAGAAAPERSVIGLGQAVQVAPPPALGLGAARLGQELVPAAWGAEKIELTVPLSNQVGLVGINRHLADGARFGSLNSPGHIVLLCRREGGPGPQARTTREC